MAFSLAALVPALGSIGNSTYGAVTVGGVNLTGTEVPDGLRKGLKQMVAVKKLIGGGRVIQPLGPDLDPVTLSAKFTGVGAQQKAKRLEALATAGTKAPVVIANLNFQGVVTEFSYDYTQVGAVIPYTITLELFPTTGMAQGTTSPSALTSLLGSGLASTISSISATVGQVGTYASSALSQVQSVLGQVAPVASMLGIGGLGKVSQYLSQAQGFAGLTTDLSQAPEALAGSFLNLQSAASSLGTTITNAAGNLTGLASQAPAGALIADAASLSTAQASAGVLAGAVQVGGTVNQAAQIAVQINPPALIPAGSP